jgi:hypothetical protein
MFQKMDSTSVAKIIGDSEIKGFIKTYINSKVKVGENISGTKKYAAGLVTFIREKYQKEIEKLKTQKGKIGKEQKLMEVLNFINEHQDQFIVMFMVAALIADVKGVLLSKLKTVNTVGSFLETPDGFKVTSPEGFVAIDKFGDAVKLVDRLEFSRANFTLAKTWT